jgi:hypothetical protein
MTDMFDSAPGADNELMARLGTVAAVADPMPAQLTSAAQALFGLRQLDAELAELVLDSADLPQTRELAVRGDDERMLSFEAGRAGVEMQVSERSDRRDIVCHVTGVPLDAAIVETPKGQLPLQVDDDVIIAHDLAAGPLRLRLTTTSGDKIVTSWVRI